MALIGTYLLVTVEIFQAYVYLCAAYFGELCVPVHKLAVDSAQKLMEQWGNFVFNGIAFLFSSVCLAVVYQPWNHMPPLDSFVGFLWLVLPSALFLAYGLYLQGVQDAGSMRAVLLGTIEPVMADYDRYCPGTSFVTDFVGSGLS